MYRCARISKPVGTPETLHDQTRRCPPSLCTRSVHTRQGRRLNAEPIARARARLLPCIIRTASREPPLRERRVSPIFPDRVRVSFYLSERVELSNTARLSLSATSSPPFPHSLSPSLPFPARRANNKRVVTRPMHASPRKLACSLMHARLASRPIAFLPIIFHLPSFHPFLPLLSSPFRSPVCSRNRELPRSAGVRIE